jgi:hypothetical protein
MDWTKVVTQRLLSFNPGRVSILDRIDSSRDLLGIRSICVHNPNF